MEELRERRLAEEQEELERAAAEERRADALKAWMTEVCRRHREERQRREAEAAATTAKEQLERMEHLAVGWSSDSDGDPSCPVFSGTEDHFSAAAQQLLLRQACLASTAPGRSHQQQQQQRGPNRVPGPASVGGSVACNPHKPPGTAQPRPALDLAVTGTTAMRPLASATTASRILPSARAGASSRRPAGSAAGGAAPTATLAPGPPGAQSGMPGDAQLMFAWPPRGASAAGLGSSKDSSGYSNTQQRAAGTQHRQGQQPGDQACAGGACSDSAHCSSQAEAVVVPQVAAGSRRCREQVDGSGAGAGLGYLPPSMLSALRPARTPSAGPVRLDSGREDREGEAAPLPWQQLLRRPSGDSTPSARTSMGHSLASSCRSSLSGSSGSVEHTSIAALAAAEQAVLRAGLDGDRPRQQSSAVPRRVSSAKQQFKKEIEQQAVASVAALIADVLRCGM